MSIVLVTVSLISVKVIFYEGNIVKQVAATAMTEVSYAVNVIIWYFSW